MSRKLTKTEASFNAVQGWLRHAEASMNEASLERAWLITTLEVNERHERELTGPSMRFELAEGARGGARKDGGRRARAAARARRTDPRIRTAKSRPSAMPCMSGYPICKPRSSSTNPNSTHPYRPRSHARASRGCKRYARRPRRRAGRSAAPEKQATDQKIEELAATLRREKLGRAVAEGALDTARKDFSRLIRGVKAMRQTRRRRANRHRRAPPTPRNRPLRNVSHRRP